MRNFFTESSKEVQADGSFSETSFNLPLQLKKLKYILENEEIALSLLKDAYFDLYLFVDLLTKTDLKTEEMRELTSLDYLYTEAVENTSILKLTKEFAKLKK